VSLTESHRVKPVPWEAELQRVNQALRVATAANKSLASASDVAGWLNQVCRSAVEVGGFPIAWIGFAEHDEQKQVRPVAHAGFAEKFIETVNITWKDEPRGRGPAGIAIRTGEHCVVRDIPNDPIFDPWRKEALQQGFKSAIALPLTGDERTFGILAIYARELDAFGPGVVEILKELTKDLAYGLVVVFRIGIQRQSHRSTGG